MWKYLPFNMVCVIKENASNIDGLISLKMASQFSFKNRFVVSPKALSPLNKLPKWATILEIFKKKKKMSANID